MKTSRIETVRVGEPDCPQYNQPLYVSTVFLFKTDLRIVFICCWQKFLSYLLICSDRIETTQIINVL